MSNRAPADPDREPGAARAKADPILALRAALGRVAPLRDTYRSWRRSRRVRDIRLFHRVVSSGDLEGRWWIWGGSLLGLERSGDILPWDTDLDVAVRRKDLPALMRTVERLRRAGFEATSNFFDGDRLIALHLAKHGFDFDFSVLDEVGPDELEYRGFTTKDGELILLEGRVPAQDLSRIDAWGCSWPCAADRDRDLAALYGSDWRTPNPGWSALDSPSLARAAPYPGTLAGWTPLDPLGAKLNGRDST